MGTPVRHSATDIAGVATGPSVNAYCPVAIGALDLATTEAHGTVTYEQAGTIRNLRVYVVSGNRSASTPGLWLRKNGVDTALGVQIAPGGTPVSVPQALSDSTNEVSVAAGDTLAWHTFGGGSGNANWTITAIAWDFEAADGSAITHYSASAQTLYQTQNETSYRNPSSDNIKTTTQANAEALLKLPAGHSIDVVALEAYASANTRTADTTFSANGASGTGTDPSLTYGSGETGRKRVTSTRAVVDGDKLSYKGVTGAGTSQTLTLQLLHMTLRSTSGLSYLIAGRVAGNGWGTTNHSGNLGGRHDNHATEARTQMLFGYARRLSLASVYVSTSNAGGTFTLRDDGGDTALAIATPNPAGWATDTVNTVDTDATSLYNWRFTRTATPTVHCIVVAVTTAGISGTGALVAPVAAVSGAGAEAMLGSGAVSAPPATVSAAGWAEITGTGAATGAAVTVVGTGVETFTGTGAVSVPAPTVAGEGAEAFTGSGAVTVPTPAVVGEGVEVFTGTGELLVEPPLVEGEGTAESGEEITGTGAAVGQPPAIAGSGWAEVTGSGAVIAGSATVAGTAEEAMLATGSVTVAGAEVSGAGWAEITGSASVTAAAPLVAASGEVMLAVTGIGAITAPAATVHGTGLGGRRRRAASAGQRVVLPPAMVFIVGQGAVLSASPTVRGAGDVNDDDLTILLAA